MPWKETNKMEQKEAFINEMLKNNKPFKHLCAEFGISEKTGSQRWKTMNRQTGVPEPYPNRLFVLCI